MSRASPLPPSGDRSKTVMVGVMGKAPGNSWTVDAVRERVIFACSGVGFLRLPTEDERPAPVPTTYLLFLRLGISRPNRYRARSIRNTMKSLPACHHDNVDNVIAARAWMGQPPLRERVQPLLEKL